MAAKKREVWVVEEKGSGRVQSAWFAKADARRQLSLSQRVTRYVPEPEAASLEMFVLELHDGSMWRMAMACTLEATAERHRTFYARSKARVRSARLVFTEVKPVKRASRKGRGK